MIERYALLAERLHQEVTDLEQVVARVEKAMSAARQHPDESDFYLDSVALNLHDVGTFERANVKRTHDYIRTP